MIDINADGNSAGGAKFNCTAFLFRYGQCSDHKYYTYTYTQIYLDVK